MTLPALQWLSGAAHVDVTLLTDSKYCELFGLLLPSVQVVAAEEASRLPAQDAVVDLHRVAGSARVIRRLSVRRGVLRLKVNKEDLRRRALLLPPRLPALLGSPLAAAMAGLAPVHSWPERHLLVIRELFDGFAIQAPERPCVVPGVDPGVLRTASPASLPPVLGIVLGAGWPLKRWTLPSWRALARGWHLESGGAVRVFSGPGEEELAGALGPLPGTTRWLADSPVALATGLVGCDVVVAGDTGPLHLAAALGRKVVGLFGPTPIDSGFWVWEGQGRLVHGSARCSPCSLHGVGTCRLPTRTCLDDLETDRVLAAAVDLSALGRRCA